MLVTQTVDAELESLKGTLAEWSNDKLLKTIERGLKMCVDNYRRMAVAVGILDTRGVEIPCNRRLLGVLRKIYRGETTALVAIRFAPSTNTMSWVMSHDLQRQEELSSLTDSEIERLMEKERRQDVVAAEPLTNGFHEVAKATAITPAKQPVVRPAPDKYYSARKMPSGHVCINISGDESILSEKQAWMLCKNICHVYGWTIGGESKAC